MIVFFDDILLYNYTMLEHLRHLQTVFDLLSKHYLIAKKSKFEFGSSQVEYLGHVASRYRVSNDPHRIKVEVDSHYLRH